VLRWARGHYFSSFLVSQLGLGLRDTAKKRHATRETGGPNTSKYLTITSDSNVTPHTHCRSHFQALNYSTTTSKTLSFPHLKVPQTARSSKRGRIYRPSSIRLQSRLACPKQVGVRTVPTLRNVFVIKLSIISVAERKDAALGVEADEGATIMVQFRR
jgi:hypothetical protein